MATIKEQLEQEKLDFQKALEGEFIKSNGKRLVMMNVQRKFVEDAIPSIEYMLMILSGKVVLPREDENLDTSWGKVFCWMQGSIVNITMAETILYGKWTNVTDCFKCMYMSLADQVNESCDDKDYDDNYDSDDFSLTDDVNALNEVDDATEEINFASTVSFADEVNGTCNDDDDDDYYTGGLVDCCDCRDILNDCCDIF